MFPLPMAALPLPYRLLGALGLALLIFLAGWRFGYRQEHERRLAEVASLNAAWATARAQAEREAREQLEQAQARGDALSRTLLAKEDALKTASRELNDEIQRRTTGRACLDAGLVRLLNGPQPAAGLKLSEAARRLDAEGGAAATDRDIAVWAGNARSQYDTCRARLDALIDWHETPHTAGRSPDAAQRNPGVSGD